MICHNLGEFLSNYFKDQLIFNHYFIFQESETTSYILGARISSNTESSKGA